MSTPVPFREGSVFPWLNKPKENIKKRSPIVPPQSLILRTSTVKTVEFSYLNGPS